MSLLLESLSKSFGDQIAVDQISFSVEKGEVAGFLGPNGSGKSTTMRCICGIIPADSGLIRVAGKRVDENPLEVKRLIGYLPEHNPLPYDLYIKEYLHHIDGFYNSASNRSIRVQNVIEMTGLEQEQHKKIGQLSKGYKQRVGLAQAIIHDPEILILDEPTTGLDPNQIVEIRNLISGLSKNKTVLLSTHILQEVEAICDKVLVLNKGKLVADGSASSLKKGDEQRKQILFVEFSTAPDPELLKKIPGIRKTEAISQNKFLLEGTDNRDLRERIFHFTVRHNLVLLSLQKKEESLEEAFRKLTQQN